MKGNCTLLERWNGVSWDLVSKRFSISGGDRDRETIEDDAFLDCISGPGADCGDYKRRAPGSKMLGELTVEVAWDPRQNGSNTQNHHLFFEDYDTCSETFWRVCYPNEDQTGEIYHAFVKTLSRGEVQADETVRLTVTLQPTGKFYIIADNVTAIPVDGQSTIGNLVSSLSEQSILVDPIVKPLTQPVPVGPVVVEPPTQPSSNH